MNKTLAALLAVLLTVGVLAFGRYWWTHKADPRIAQFHQDTDNLLQALQQYKEFVKSYPTGSNLEISRALSGQGEKKVTILAVHKSELNSKGEIIDQWGTPLQFYFGPNSILIRSAGPNQAFEDSKSPGYDDLFRSN